MYAALWRRIPGGLPGKIVGMLGLLLSALALLFFVIFPAIEPHLPWNDVTVDTPRLTPATVASPTATVSPTAAVSPSASLSPAGSAR